MKDVQNIDQYNGQPIREGLSFEEWKEYGLNLGRIEKIYMWKVGEWWTYGEINYGDKTSIIKSEDWDGPSYQTCANAGWVFKKFHFSRRRENLSWAHHAVVASLDEEDADRFLDDAITHKWSHKKLREQVSEFKGKNGKAIAFSFDDDKSNRQAPADLEVKGEQNSEPSPSSPSSPPKTGQEKKQEVLDPVTPATVKPGISPEALNIGLRADLNKATYAAEILRDKLNKAEKELEVKDEIIARQYNELVEANNRIESLEKQLADRKEASQKFLCGLRRRLDLNKD